MGEGEDEGDKKRLIEIIKDETREWIKGQDVGYTMQDSIFGTRVSAFGFRDKMQYVVP